MTHKMAVFLGGMTATLFTPFIGADPSLGKSIAFAVFGAILGYGLYPVGSTFKHKGDTPE